MLEFDPVICDRLKDANARSIREGGIQFLVMESIELDHLLQSDCKSIPDGMSIESIYSDPKGNRILMIVHQKFGEIFIAEYRK